MRQRGALTNLDGVKGIVLTRDSSYPVDTNWTTAHSPDAAIDALAKLGAAKTLVVGGQSVNTAFAAAGLLDEIVLFLESVAIGRACPSSPPRTCPT